jgi:mannonate dehydratase
MLKIIDAKVIVTCPGRNFVTLKITTSDGVTGVGDATLNGREMAVVSYLRDHMIPCLIGRDAHRIEDIWQFFYRGSYWRGGPVGMTALAAVDMALWDIKAKVAGLPLYQLLGGACREGVTVYGHANGETIEDTIAEAVKYKAWATRPFACRRACRAWPAPTGCRATRCSTSRPTGTCPPRTSGRRPSISSTRPSCSRPRARRWATTSTCCTTSITA